MKFKLLDSNLKLIDLKNILIYDDKLLKSLKLSSHVFYICSKITMI